MKFISSVVFFLLLITKTYSQNYASMFSVNVKNKDVIAFQSVNKKANEATLFLADNKQVNAVLLNDQLAFKDSLSIKKPDDKYNSIVGYTIADKKSTIFWTTESFSSFFLQSFDFENKKVETKLHNFNITGEYVIQFFSENENFYILSYIKTTNALKLTTFNNNNESTEVILDSSKLTYSLNLLLDSKLSENKEKALKLEKITIDEPVFFTESLKKNKCYSNKSQLILTFDSNLAKTTMVIVDLVTNIVEEKQIDKPTQIDNTPISYSNSFVLEDKIFQIAGTKQNLLITIKNFDNTIVKEFSTIKNADIFDKITYYSEQTIGSPFPLSSKEKFIKQLENNTFGFSCYKTNDNYVLSIAKPIPLKVDSDKQNNYVMYGGMIGGFTGALIGYALSPSNQSFVNSMNSGKLYFNFWMDSSFNDVPMKYSTLASEKLRKSLKDRTPEKGETIFSVNNILYLGSCNFGEKRYFIRKFTD